MTGRGAQLMLHCWLCSCLNALKDGSAHACVSVCPCPRWHTPLSFYYMGQWLHHLSGFTLCSPRRLILPWGMVLMWETGRVGEEGGWLHTLSVWEQLTPHGHSLCLLPADFNVLHLVAINLDFFFSFFPRGILAAVNFKKGTRQSLRHCDGGPGKSRGRAERHTCGMYIAFSQISC